MNRLTWYWHLGGAVWEVFLYDADVNEYVRVQKGHVRGLDGHTDEYVAWRVLQAATLAMRNGIQS